MLGFYQTLFNYINTRILYNTKLREENMRHRIISIVVCPIIVIGSFFVLTFKRENSVTINPSNNNLPPP